MHKHHAFTIVEILIVVFVIAILAGLIIVNYSGVSNKALLATMKSDLESASKQIRLYEATNGELPTSLDCSASPVAKSICLKSSSTSTTFVYYLPAINNPTFYSLTAVNGTTVQSLDSANLSSSGGINLLANSDIEKTSLIPNEFMQYADIASIIDKWGLRQYTISFDIKSANTSLYSSMRVYCQNGSDARYYIGNQNVPVTTQYTRQSVTVTPTNQNLSLPVSMLAFYGNYGTGNIPTVKNVKIELGNTATPWTPAP